MVAGAVSLKPPCSDRAALFWSGDARMIHLPSEAGLHSLSLSEKPYRWHPCHHLSAGFLIRITDSEAQGSGQFLAMRRVDHNPRGPGAGRRRPPPPDCDPAGTSGGHVRRARPAGTSGGHVRRARPAGTSGGHARQERRAESSYAYLTPACKPDAMPLMPTHTGALVTFFG